MYRRQATSTIQSPRMDQERGVPMAERRYTEEEVSNILDRATREREGGLQRGGGPDGLTLDELREIGREVGISPAVIEEAARAIDRQGHSITRRWAGFPLGVGHSVRLGRHITDEEWERLVVDLRHTFGAKGRLRVEGGFREWSNGNLQALVEPAPEGDVLRLKTLKGDARTLMTVGGILGAIGAVQLVVGLAGSAVAADRLWDHLLVALVGAGLFAFSALRLPSWAKLRRRQMEAVADRLVQALNAGSPEVRESGSEGA
jgi:hypothetical protein